MSNDRLKHIIHREAYIIGFCLIIGITLAVAGRIIGGENNSGIFFFTLSVFSGILYFFIQSIRAIGWSIYNLMKHE